MHWRYLLFGENRVFFFGVKTGKLYGICAYDENYKYVNFRYCAVLPVIRGLKETIWQQFLQYVFFAKSNKLVNSGGSFKKKSIYNFKLKFSPVEINEIYTGEVIL